MQQHRTGRTPFYLLQDGETGAAAALSYGFSLPFQSIADLVTLCSLVLCHPWPLSFFIFLKHGHAQGIVQQSQEKDTLSGCCTASFIPAALELLKGHLEA